MVLTHVVNNSKNIQSSEKINSFISECLEKGIPLEKIGYEFEKTKLSDNDKKKKNGQFYTPEHIVEYIIQYLSIDKKMKIIDPACGTGSFLIPIIQKLYNGEKLDSVYGIDIDSEALELLTSLLNMMGLEIRTENLINGNTIVSNKEISNRALDLKSITPDNGFDIVIGNPPFTTLKKWKDYDPKDEDYQGLLNGQVNAATLMIAKGLKILKPKGILAYVLPKNILHVDSYALLREYLLNNTTILHIVDLRSSFKNVRGEQIVLFIQKKKPNNDHVIEIKVESNESSESVYIEQNRFLKGNKIHVFERNEDYLLINDLINQGLPLKKLVNDQIFRGISLPSKYVKKLNTNNSGKVLPYIRGKNIQKFSMTPELGVDKNDLSMLNNEKINDLLKPKLVVQNIFSSESGIIGDFDQKGILTNETVTNIIVENYNLAIYLLALLNSKIANYFLIYACFNCSKMTMHTDKQYIGSIPVIIPQNNALLNQIVELVNSIKKDTNKNRIKDLQRKIDQIFYTQYKLNQNEIELIESGLDLFLSKKSRW